MIKFRLYQFRPLLLTMQHMKPTRTSKYTKHPDWHIINLMNQCILNDNNQEDPERKRLIETAVKNLKLSAVMKCWANNLHSAVLNREITQSQVSEFWNRDAAGFANNSEILK